MAACPGFSSGVRIGTETNPLLKEASGIIASRKNKNVLWSHNDSGGLNRIWALNKQGIHLGTYNLSGIAARDWEDIAIGPGPADGVDYLYIADTGNNDGLTNYTYTILRIEEPSVFDGQNPVDTDVGDANSLLVKYPDSLRHDCETLLVDPNNGDIYVCTRDRWTDDNNVMKIYRYPAPHTPGVEYTMQHVADVQLLAGEMAVGGEISPDGSEIIIRTKGDHMRVLLWQRNAGTNLWDAFTNPVCVMPQINEPQGEAVCFESNGCGYFTVSEGLNQPIYYFARSAQCPNTLASDFNADGIVGLEDLSQLTLVWLQQSLTGRNFVTVDGFESYNDTPDLESQWYDYAENPVQSLETTEVYSGAKAMRWDFGGTVPALRKALGTAEDWSDFETVRILFKGSNSNKAKDITLSIFDSTDTMAASGTYAGGTKTNSWTALELDLTAADTLLLQAIRYVNLTIAAEGKSGTVHFDNIEKVSSDLAYVCEGSISEDLDVNCWTDMFDLSLFSRDWLISYN